MISTHHFSLDAFARYRLDVDHDAFAWRLWVLPADGAELGAPLHTGRWNPRDRSVSFEAPLTCGRSHARTLQGRITQFLPQPLTRNEIN